LLVKDKNGTFLSVPFFDSGSLAKMAAQAAMSDRDFVPVLPNGENGDKNDKNE
jgi:hypothetical protein